MSISVETSFTDVTSRMKLEYLKFERAMMRRAWYFEKHSDGEERTRKSLNRYCSARSVRRIHDAFYRAGMEAGMPPEVCQMIWFGSGGPEARLRFGQPLPGLVNLLTVDPYLAEFFYKYAKGSPTFALLVQLHPMATLKELSFGYAFDLFGRFYEIPSQDIAKAFALNLPYCKFMRQATEESAKCIQRNWNDKLQYEKVGSKPEQTILAINAGYLAEFNHVGLEFDRSGREIYAYDSDCSILTHYAIKDRPYIHYHKGLSALEALKDYADKGPTADVVLLGDSLTRMQNDERREVLEMALSLIKPDSGRVCFCLFLEQWSDWLLGAYDYWNETGGEVYFEEDTATARKVADQILLHYDRTYRGFRLAGQVVLASVDPYERHPFGMTLELASTRL